MDHLLDDEEQDTPAQAEHELTLSTGAILGIFLGLVLLCGAFFGFGYKMGSHKPAPVADATVIEATPATGTNFNAFKPAAGSPAGGSAPVAAPAPVAVPATTAADTADSDTPAAPPEAAPIVHPATASTPPHSTTPAAVPTAAPVPTGTIFVQVAAVSHKEDADLLVGALKAKGYPVAAYSAADKLFHIQVGPFASRATAESTRQRLLADGYQPILK
jgi:cell division septation protein DedD